MQRGGLEVVLLSIAREKQVFYLGNSFLCSLVMQADPTSANRGAGELWVGASSCSSPGWSQGCVWWLLIYSSSTRCLPFTGRCALRSLVNTFCSLGMAQAAHFLAEKWKIFSSQLPEGLAHVFPPGFHAVVAGCAP